RSAGGQLQRVTPAEAGWRYLSFEAHRLTAGDSLHINAKGQESLIIVLEGTATVRAGNRTFSDLGTRDSVFDGRPPAMVLVAPGGNWSSYPPHKHDTEDPPRESYLEELYYYRLAKPTGFAFQRIYTPDRSLDEALVARDGDLVLVPRGYHVVATAPGYDCYYL